MGEVDADVELGLSDVRVMKIVMRRREDTDEFHAQGRHLMGMYSRFAPWEVTFLHNQGYIQTVQYRGPKYKECKRKTVQSPTSLEKTSMRFRESTAPMHWQP